MMAYRTINAFSLDQRNFSSVERSGTGSWVVPEAAAFLDGSGLRLPGTVGNYASVPDSSEVSVLGDIDIKVKLELPDWSPSSLVFVLSKWLTTGDQRSFYFGVNTNGTLRLTVDGDGTGTSAVSGNSTAATGFDDGVTKWIRATLDVDNGSSQAVFKFYTSDDGDTWSQLGTNVTSPGVISIYDSTAVLEVGSYNTGVVGHAPMTVYRTIIQDAFDTTDNTTSVVFDADFSSQVPFTQSFTEDSGIATPATVTINAAAPSVATATSKIPMFPTYIPSENAPYALEALVTAIPTTNGHSTVDVYSPLVPSTAGAVYTFSIGAMPLNNNLNYIIEPQFYQTSAGVTLVDSGRDPIPVNVTDGASFLLYDYVQAPTGSTHCRIKITIGGYRTNIATPVDLPEDVGSVFFDPIICDASANAISFFSNSVYSSLPSFMLLDDENINNILPAAGGASQSPQPLRRYVEVLCNAADKMYLELDEFRYDRAVDGDEHKSKLVDPDTAEERYLLWLAAATGSRLLTFISGLTPWAALEAYEGTPISGDPGEWEDFESFDDWLTLESSNPDFFDAVQSYRDQIRTGVTGLNGGRPDKIVEYVRTMLESNTSDTDVVVLHNEHMDSPFRAKLVVDPNVDPDVSGSLIEDFVNNVGSVGSYIVKDSKVHHSGRGVYQFDDALYPNTYSNAAACGSVIYGQPFISDYDYTGQHIVLNAEAAGVSAAAADGAVVPDLGGGIGHSHYSADSSYFFGWDGSTPGSLTTAGSPIANLGASTNYDVIAVLTDIIEPSADVWSQVSASTPPDYLFRQKRLIACGTDSDGADNDWALYMVSGLTASADNDVRLLLVDGYMDTSGADNYAYSDPIDSSFFSQHKNFCLRVSKTGTSYKFYVQNSLYDDWESNTIGSGTFNPSSAAASTLSNAGVQVLGELNNSLWSDAYPLACAVKRLMVFNDTLTFVSEGDTSASAHTISNGGEIDDFGVYSYTPNVDIDVSGVSLYATSFNASTYQSGVVGTLLVDVSPVRRAWLDGTGLRLPGKSGHYASTPDSAALDITGDIEIVVRAAFDEWDRPDSPTTEPRLVDKLGGTFGGYRLDWRTSTDRPRLLFGNGSTYIALAANADPLFVDGTTYWIKVEFDVDNGSGQYEAKFYTAPDSEAEPGSWTQLGTTIVGGSTASIANSSSPVAIGEFSSGAGTSGTVYRAIIRDGIGGTTVFDADFAAETAGTLSFTEDSSNAATVTINSPSPNDIDILAMRPHQTYGTLWHVGNAPNTSTDDRLSVTFASAAQRYWRIHTINPSDGSIVTSTTQDAGSTATINIDAYPTYAGASVLAIEVRDDDSGWGDGTAPGTTPDAYFTPTLLATTDSAADSYTGTWSITRAWPADGFAYSPSQTIDLPCIHMYESTPELVSATNSVHGFSLEHWSPFSMFFHIKRVWTGTEGTDIYDIFNVDYGSGSGFRIYYDGPKIKATFSDGTNTESVEWEETSPAYGEWHTVVVRRNNTTFGIVVDADTAGEATTSLALTTPLPDTTPSRYFSKGAVSTWTPRFALARFTFFNRYLSDAEIALLETEV